MIPKQIAYTEGLWWRQVKAAYDVPRCGVHYAAIDRIISYPAHKLQNNSIVPPLAVDGVADYRGRIARGESATSDRQLSVYRVVPLVVSTETTAFRDSTNQAYYCYGVRYPYPPLCEYVTYYTRYAVAAPDPSAVQAMLDAQTEVWDEIRRKLTNIYRDGLLGETLASIHRAVDLVRHPFKRATQLIDVYKRRSLRRIKRFRDTLPRAARRDLARGRDAVVESWTQTHLGRKRLRRLLAVERRLREDWLYYSFGIVNAAADIEAIVKATNREQRVGSVIRVRERRSASGSKLGPRSQFFTTPGGTVHSQLLDETFTSLSITLGIHQSAANISRREDTAARLGLSAEAFIPTLWAVMPGSWAVDYFFDVDGHIDDWLARRVKFAWGCRSFCTRVTRRTTNTSFVPYATGTMVWTGRIDGESLDEKFSQQRTAVTTIPFKPFRFDFPTKLSQFANLWSVFSPTKSIGVRSL